MDKSPYHFTAFWWEMGQMYPNEDNLQKILNKIKPDEIQLKHSQIVEIFDSFDKS